MQFCLIFLAKQAIAMLDNSILQFYTSIKYKFLNVPV